MMPPLRLRGLATGTPHRQATTLARPISTDAVISELQGRERDGFVELPEKRSPAG
jgi:hypothetical protein